ncbi:MAG TPA: CBS domain-containing protein [Pyrinomonadaceae bacterium]
MPRNRYDRDDRDYNDRNWRSGGRGDEDRYGSVERGFGYDDPYRTRRGGGDMNAGGRYYGREIDGRGGYGERADYRPDERRYSNYQGGRPDGRSRDYDRYDDSRSWYESARDYVGGSRGEERGRGASRSHVRCRDIMTRDVTVATRETSLLDVAAMMRDEDTGVIPVVERYDTESKEGNGGGNGRGHTKGNGKLVGLITDRDIALRAVAEGKDSRTTHAAEVMTEDIHTAHPNDRVIEVIRKMGDKQVRRIPVVDDSNNLLGIISMADVALETEEDRELAEALEEISSGSSFWSKIFG